jgi:hypothetical protein
VSPAFAVSDANAISIRGVAIVLTGTKVNIDLEISDDHENWTGLGTLVTLSSVGMQQGQLGSIATKFIRLTPSLIGSGVAIIDVMAHTAKL